MISTYVCLCAVVCIVSVIYMVLSWWLEFCCYQSMLRWPYIYCWMLMLLLLEHRQHIQKVACFLAPNFLIKPIPRIIFLITCIIIYTNHALITERIYPCVTIFMILTCYLGRKYIYSQLVVAKYTLVFCVYDLYLLPSYKYNRSIHVIDINWT